MSHPVRGCVFQLHKLLIRCSLIITMLPQMYKEKDAVFMGSSSQKTDKKLWKNTT